MTGGTGALGAAVVGALVQAGAACTVPWLHENEAERFPYRENKQVKLVGPVDLADEAAVNRLFAGVPALWASVHIAGGFAMSPVAKTGKAPIDAADRHQSRELLPLLRGRGQRHRPHRPRAGASSMLSSRPALEWRIGAGMAAYTATKAAVAALTVALSEEVAKDGILVNAVAPSIMDTPANRAAMPKANYDLWPKVEEVAATILFLASPENKVTRGAVVPVYGKS